MPVRTNRHLQLLELSKHLHRYAKSLQEDVNASYLLVHRTLSGAFAERTPAERSTEDLQTSLRADLKARSSSPARGARNV